MFVEKTSQLAMCAPEIYLPVVRLFMKEPTLIPIVELMFILKGGFN
jgi:hypothetical protein